MKKILFLAVCFYTFLSCSQSKRIKVEKNTINPSLESLGNDSLKYVKLNFIDKKDKYIGQPFNVLLRDLQIEIKSYLIGVNMKKRNEAPDASFSFLDDETLTTKIINNEQPLLIHVRWERPLSMEFAVELARKTNRKWTKEVEKYYGKQIIKDLLLTDYEIGKKKE